MAENSLRPTIKTNVRTDGADIKIIYKSLIGDLTIY